MHAVKVKLKKKQGGIIIYPRAGGKCHIWTGTIYHITRGACMSARQGCLVDLQNSSSKLAMPRKKELQWIMTVKLGNGRPGLCK